MEFTFKKFMTVQCGVFVFLCLLTTIFYPIIDDRVAAFGMYVFVDADVWIFSMNRFLLSHEGLGKVIYSVWFVLKCFLYYKVNYFFYHQKEYDVAMLIWANIVFCIIATGIDIVSLGSAYGGGGYQLN